MSVKKRLIAAALAMAALFMVAACGSDTGQSQEKTEISFNGSSTLAPVISSIGKDFAEKNGTWKKADSSLPDAGITINVSSSGSGAGIKALLDGTADFGLVAREVKDSEKQKIKDYKEYKIGIDALTIAVNPNNPIAGLKDNLTSDQIKKIFSGEYKTWNQVDPSLPEKEIGAAILEKYGVPEKGKKIGIAFRNWQGLEDHKSELAEAADRLIRLYDSRIVFIPMQFPADVQAAEEIAAHMSEAAIVLKEAYNTEEFMSLIGAMDLIIANRLHALVFAAVMDIPVTAVSYDPKIDGFVSLIGETVCTTMEALSAAAVVEDASAKLQHRAKDEAVRARIQALKNRAWRNNILVAELLKKSGRYSE